MSEPTRQTAPDNGYTLSWDWKESLPLALDDVAEVLARYGIRLTDISGDESDQIEIHICAQEAEPAPARVLAAADLADAPLPDDVQRTAGLLRAAATMYGDEDVLAAADLVERQSLEIARLRRMLAARHLGVEAAAEDEFDIAAARAAVANPEPPIPHEQVMRELGLTTEATVRPAESAVERPTTPPEGERVARTDPGVYSFAVTTPQTSGIWTVETPLAEPAQALSEVIAAERDRLRGEAEAREGELDKLRRLVRAWRTQFADLMPADLADNPSADLAAYVDALDDPAKSAPRPTQSHIVGQTGPGEGHRTVADTLIWDWKEQPDLDDLAAILARHGVRLTQVDNGTDEYEILISSADECPTLAQVLATDTGSHDDSVCGWCADLRAKREDARGRLRKLTYNAIRAGRIFVPVGAREDVARAVVDALECDADTPPASQEHPKPAPADKTWLETED